MSILKNIYLLILLFPVHAAAVVTVYLDEPSYLTALAQGGYGVLHESFENDVTWADSRNSIGNPGSTPQVDSQGIQWTSNFPDNNISTGDIGGSAVDGYYGFYSNPHGDQNAESADSICDVPDPIPEQCFLHDGFIGTSMSAGVLYGVGGWIDATWGADIALFLDGIEVNFGAASKISNWSFFGVIDTEGFSSFKFDELDGKAEQAVYIFADDFNFAVAGIPPVSDIKANNSDGPVTITTTDNLSLTVALDAGNHENLNADWWLLATTTSGNYYYQAGGNIWLPGSSVSYQGPLSNMAQPLEVLNMSGLPVGANTFYFGVDTIMDGLRSVPLYYDAVEVTVTNQ